MTTPTEPSVLKAAANAPWEQGITGHPNDDDMRKRDVVGGLVSPAIGAWCAASAGRGRILAIHHSGHDRRTDRRPQGIDWGPSVAEPGSGGAQGRPPWFLAVG